MEIFALVLVLVNLKCYYTGHAILLKVLNGEKLEKRHSSQVLSSTLPNSTISKWTFTIVAIDSVM